MTDIDLDALEATARAVSTPGPWETRCEGYGEPTRVCHDSEYVIYLGYDYAADLGAEDAEHIAAFDPPTVLALIARLREAEAAIEAIDAIVPMWPRGMYGAPQDMIGRNQIRPIITRYKTTKTEGSER